LHTTTINGDDGVISDEPVEPDDDTPDDADDADDDEG
jgi:hypothetical protein